MLGPEDVPQSWAEQFGELLTAPAQGRLDVAGDAQHERGSSELCLQLGRGARGHTQDACPPPSQR